MEIIVRGKVVSHVGQDDGVFTDGEERVHSGFTVCVVSVVETDC